MTKAKVIEDLRKHGIEQKVTVKDKNGKDIQVYKPFFKSWLGDGYAYYINGAALYRDQNPLPDFEYGIEEIKWAKDHFENNRLKRIDIDKAVLKDCIKATRRGTTHPTEAFKINYKGGVIVINPWFLQDMLEYTKNYAIYIDEDWNGNETVYKKPVYGFSEDFTTIQCITLPINVDYDVFKCCIENPNMKIESEVA